MTDHLSTCCHMAHQLEAYIGGHEGTGSDMRDEVRHGSEPGLWQQGPGLGQIEYCSYKLLSTEPGSELISASL